MFLLLAVSELCVFLALWVWLETLLNRSLSGLSLSFNSPVALIFTPVGNLSFLGKLYQVQAKNALILSGNSSGANERQLYLQANLITALKKLPVSVLALLLQRSTHFKGVLDESLITVDTTSLDQHKLYYYTIALICHIAKVKAVSLVHFMTNVIPIFSVSNILFESNTSIEPNENIFSTS